jgi:hypothetical protein
VIRIAEPAPNPTDPVCAKIIHLVKYAKITTRACKMLNSTPLIIRQTEIKTEVYENPK